MNLLVRAIVITFFLIESFLLFGQETHEIKKDSTKSKTSFFKSKGFKTFWPSAALLGAGLFVMNDDQDKDDVFGRYRIWAERNEHFSNFRNHVDDYLVFTPIVAVYALNLAGVKGKNDFINRTLLIAKSEIIMMALTTSLKRITAVPRPDTGAPTSFPSGHTAQAFAAAAFIEEEFKDKSIWYPIAGYTVAASVGVLRVLNNRHWLSDVFAGAGIGILSTKLTYLTHRYRWGKQNNKGSAKVIALPVYNSGPGFYFSYVFK
jgi:membrane-associated phospholipid phosphatase